MLTWGMMLMIGANTEPQPINDEATWITSEDFPTSVLVQNISGVTQVSLSVNRVGRVTGCEIEQSSGSAALDATACITISERARFRPPHDSEGHPIASTYTKRVRWQAPGTQSVVAVSNGYWSSKGVVMRLHMRPDHSIAACTALTTSGDVLDDEKVTDLCESARDPDSVAYLIGGEHIPEQGVWMDVRNQIIYYHRPPDWASPTTVSREAP